MILWLYRTKVLLVGGILNQQVLFSVYVHPPPDYEGYSQDSLFYNTEIADRVNSSWGTFDLAQVGPSMPSLKILHSLERYLRDHVVVRWRETTKLASVRPTAAAEEEIREAT